MEPVAVVEALYAAFARRDPAALIALADPAVEVRAPTGTIARGGEPYRGHDGLRRWLGDIDRMWSRLDIEVDELRVAGERVVALGRVRAHGAGRIIDAPAGWVWHVRGGRILAGEVFETRRAALAAAEAALKEVPPEAGRL